MDSDKADPASSPALETRALGRRGVLKLGISIALIALTAVVFGEVLSHGFADLDDLAGIEYNDALEVGSLEESLSRAFGDSLLSNWMPMTVLSHQLDRALYGTDAGGHHLTSVILHAASSVLLFLVFSSMTGSLGASAFVAGVFAVHPLHVETVAWISERKGAISGFFFVLTLWAYGRYARHVSAARYVGVLGALALALLSKPTTVTLPCVLLLLDYWPLRRLSLRACYEKLPMFALVIASSTTTYWVQQATGAMNFGESLAWPTRILNAVTAYGDYLAKTFWPVDLAAFYRYQAAEPWMAGGVALALLGASALFLALRTTRPYLIIGWLWFLGMLVPMLGLVQVGLQSHADRYMYLPLIGLSLLVAFAVRDLGRRAGLVSVTTAAGLVVIAALAVGSRNQVNHWQNGFALWGRVLAVDPQSGLAYRGLGSLHARLLELDQAEASYLKAFELEPDETRFTIRTYFLTKASHLSKRGDAEGMLESYRLAVLYDPQHPAAQRALGLALETRGRRAEALPHLQRALAVRPGDVPVLLAFAAAAEAEGHLQVALQARRRVLELAPESASNVNNLAWLLATAEDPEVQDAEEAVRLAEGLVSSVPAPSANQLDTLVAAYAAAGRVEEATRTARRALDILERGSESNSDALRSRLERHAAGQTHRE